MPDENQGPSKMYALIFHSDELILLLESLPKQSLKRDMTIQ